MRVRTRGWLALGFCLVLAASDRLAGGLLVVSDRVHGDTAFGDSSGAGHTVIAAGGVSHTTAVDFPDGSGSSSIGFYSYGNDYLTVADSTDWAFGVSDFTVDFWLRLPNASQQALPINQGSDGNNRWFVTIYGNSPLFAVYSGGTALVQLVDQSVDLASNTWYHYAVVRSGSTFTQYLNGSQVGSSVTYAGSLPDFSGLLTIGTDSQMLWGGATSLVGYMDNVRITNGTALWTSDFTPPLQPQPVPEPASLALFAGAVAALLGRRSRPKRS